MRGADGCWFLDRSHPRQNRRGGSGRRSGTELSWCVGSPGSRIARACGRPIAPGGTRVEREHAGARSRTPAGSTIDADTHFDAVDPTDHLAGIERAPNHGDQFAGRAGGAGADIVSHARIQQRPVPRHISAGAFGLTPPGSACAAGTNDLDSSRFVVLPARAAEGPSAPARRRAPGRRSGPPERRVVVAECGGDGGGGGGELHAAAAAAEVGGGMRRLALVGAVGRRDVARASVGARGATRSLRCAPSAKRPSSRAPVVWYSGPVTVSCGSRVRRRPEYPAASLTSTYRYSTDTSSQLSCSATWADGNKRDISTST